MHNNIAALLAPSPWWLSAPACLPKTPRQGVMNADQRRAESETRSKDLRSRGWQRQGAAREGQGEQGARAAQGEASKELAAGGRRLGGEPWEGGRAELATSWRAWPASAGPHMKAALGCPTRCECLSEVLLPNYIGRPARETTTRGGSRRSNRSALQKYEK